MSRRPLVLVLGLTIGDYLLWNWSLSGNHDVIALASGLTLPPLALVATWLLAVAAGRTLGRLTNSRRTPARTTGQRRQSRGYAEQTARRRATAAPSTGTSTSTGNAATAEQPASSKLAA